MKRKRGRKPGKKRARAPSAQAEEVASPEESTTSPSTEATNSPEDQGEDEAPAPTAPSLVPEPTPTPPPPPPPPSEPPQKMTAAATSSHADITYTKPKVGAVYGRVKLKFKSSKTAELPPQQKSSSEVQAPSADAGKPGNTAVTPETTTEVAVEKVALVKDGQQTEGSTSELSCYDKEKVVRKVGGIKIKSAGLPSSSSADNSTPDRKADVEDGPPPTKQETILESKEVEDTTEPKSSQESEEKQSTPERRRDDKELAAALEAIKKVMKMDAAEPFNVPVDPVALGIPDYFDIIDTPMDFGTICQNIEHSNKYMNSEDVYKDVQFIWDNCTKYNSKGDYIIELMKRVKKAFMKNWLAAGLYSDMPESGGNDNTGDEDTKGHSKSKSHNKRRRPGNDRHKSDCLCAVCQVTRRKKEKDEILAVIDNETAAMNSNTLDQHNLEGNSGADNPGSHDTSSQEQPSQADMYKEAAEENDSDVQMEDLGKFSSDRPSSMLHPVYEDESSRLYSDRKEGMEDRDLNNQEEHTPTQPHEHSGVEHDPKAQMESSPDVEMEDYPVQQENPSFMQLCASLFPSNQRSIFRGRHSLFRRQRQAPSKESPLHAAMAAIMKQ